MELEEQAEEENELQAPQQTQWPVVRVQGIDPPASMLPVQELRGGVTLWIRVVSDHHGQSEQGGNATETGRDCSGGGERTFGSGWVDGCTGVEQGQGGTRSSVGQMGMERDNGVALRAGP